MKQIKISDISVEKIKKGCFVKELPELYQLKKVVENNDWHKKEIVFDHTLTILKSLANIIKNIPTKVFRYLNQNMGDYKRRDLLFLAAVFHDIGKKETLMKINTETSCPNHEKVSAIKTKKILNYFDLSKKEKKFIIQIIKNHTFLHTILSPRNKKLELEYKKFKRTLSDIFLEIAILCMADTVKSYLKTTNPTEFKFRMNFYKNILKNY